MSLTFSELQNQAATLLNAHEYFSPTNGAKAIPIIVENRGDVASKVERKVATIGLCVVILTPVGAIENPEHPTPSFRPQLVAVVIENVVINRAASGTGERADKVALIVAELLHQTTDAMLLCQAIEINEEVAAEAKGVAYNVRFTVENPVLPPEAIRGDAADAIPAGLEDGILEGLEDGTVAGLEG